MFPPSSRGVDGRAKTYCEAVRPARSRITLRSVNVTWPPDADGVTPHAVRDAYAARLVQAKGGSLLKVSKLLWHATVVMTQKYAHLSPEATGADAADALDRLHSMNRQRVTTLWVVFKGKGSQNRTQ